MPAIKAKSVKTIKGKSVKVSEPDKISLIKGRKYGWRPDLPDARNLSFTPMFASMGIEIALPPSIDLRKDCSKIEDQGQLGSCTGNMLAGILEYKDRVMHAPNLIDYSRLFAYYFARKQEGTVSYDAGASIRDVIKVISLYGVCDEKLWPYDINKFDRLPSQKAVLDATNRKISTYHRLDDNPDRSAVLHNIKTALAGREPVALGISVYQSFESAAVAKSGIVPMPALAKERLLGGHAVGLFGYDDSKRWLVGRNSWGSNWGDHGYFYLPYDYILNANLSADMWVVDFNIPKVAQIMQSYVQV